MNECSFSLGHYSECLRDAKKRGYDFFRFCDFESSQEQSRVIFLRHDIDVLLEESLDLAKMEQQLGIRATYFLRLTAIYNPFAPKNFQIIKQIIELGHEIGYHYDLHIFNQGKPEEAPTLLRVGLKFLESIFDIKIVSVAPHLPVGTGIFNLPDELIAKTNIRHQAYSDELFKELKYISDSRGHWREGCMCNFIRNETPRLQILTHPFWWYQSSPMEVYSR